MKATDLRIGNIVYYDSTMMIGKYVEICSIECTTDNNGVRVFNGLEDEKGNKHLTSVISFDDIKPIPLGNELFEALNFKRFMLEERGLTCFKQNQRDEFFLIRTERGYEIAIHEKTEELSGTVGFKPMEYVHEFQNTWYQLTGYDLSFNPALKMPKRGGEN